VSREQELEELKGYLYERLLSAPPGAVAGIAAQYRLTLAELADLTGGEEESELDELAAKRKSRRSDASHLRST
jgi:hypothetical protein